VGYQQLTQGFANLILAMFEDTCSITKTEFINTDGVLTEDPDSVVLGDIQCAYEPIAKRAKEIKEMIEAGLLSENVTHILILPATDDTMSITFENVITVNARDNRPELIFEQPVRLDESLSSLLTVVAVLRNQ